MNMACEKLRAHLVDTFADPVARVRRDTEAWGHLRSCDGCRHVYNRVARVERFVSAGSVAAIAPRELEAMGRAAIDGAVKRDAAAGASARPKRSLWGWSMLAFAAATGAVLLFFVPMISQRGATPEGAAVPGLVSVEGDGFQPRSAAPPAAARSGLRAFCLDAAGRLVTPLERRGGEPAPTCPRGGLLKLTVSHRGTQPYLFVVGLDAQYAPKWYAPRPPEVNSVAAPPRGTIDQPLGSAIRIATNHDAGPLAIFAIFSAAPLTSKDVEAAAARLLRDKVPLQGVVALPLEPHQTTQHLVRLRITP